MTQYIREPINSFTHLAGAILAFIGLIALVVKASLSTPSPLAITAVIIFGLSMMLLYIASTVYHAVVANEKVIAFLRRLDHSMIFILIAGSYTPFCLIALQGTTGWVLFGVIALVAVLGVTFKMVWFDCPRWLSTSLYIGMGWIAIFAISPLADALHGQGLTLLVLGGVIYTIGGIIYAVKPAFLQFKYIGFHEIFHVFILFGSLSHFLAVFFYVI